MTTSRLLTALLLVALARTAACGASTPSACSVKGPDGNTYDFSSLTKTDGSSYQVSQDQYNYTFNVCAPLPPDNACAGLATAANASVCQAGNGEALAVIAKWDSSARLGFSSDGLPEISTANGDKCFPSEKPRTSEIKFVCSPNRRVGEISIFNTGCDYAVQFETSLACGSSPVKVPCGLTNNGATYDLTPLKGKVLRATVDQYEYSLSVCSNGLNGGQDWAVQNSSAGGALVAALGSWTATGDGTPQWSLDYYGNPVVATANGDACYPSQQPRAAALEFVCSPTVPLGELSLVSQAGCTYHFSVPTQYACGKN